MVVITIQAQLLDGFPTPLATPLPTRVLTFHIHAKKKIGKKEEVCFGSTKVQTHNHSNVNSMHNISTNSCFMIIPKILGLFYHSS